MTGAAVSNALFTLRSRIANFFRNENVILMAMAVVSGFFGGYCALGFRAAASFVLWMFYRSDSEHLVVQAAHLPWWQIVLPVALGGLLVGALNERLLGGRRPQGIAHIMECSLVHGGVMPLKPGLGSAISSAVSIGVGASVGREGSVLHFTATLASWLGQRIGLPARHAQTLLGCSLAAAMAASFNAPIAGVFFALEVVLGHYALSAFAPVVIASVVGTIITRIHYGDFPAFVLPHYDVVTYWEFPAFLLLGAICGFTAILFSWSVFFAQDRFAQIPIPRWAKPGLGGLAVGIIGVWFPQVLSVGYETIDLALNAQMGLLLLVLLALLKTLATTISVGSGFGGGVFSPSLYLGAMTGGVFGLIADHAAPGLHVHPGLYAVVGMAATSAAVLGHPISTILMVFEILGDFKVTVGVMSGAAVASVLVNQLLGKSFYSWQLERRGVVIEGARARRILRSRTVSEVMTLPHQLIPATMTLGDLKRLLTCLPEGAEAMVVGEENRLVGTIAMADIKDVAFDPLVNDEGMEAQHLTHLYPTALALDASLDEALETMEHWKAEQLPVVKDADSMEVAGLLLREALVRAHNDALLQAEAEAHGGAPKPISRAATKV